MNRPFKMIGTITADQLRDLIRASISDMPEWDPSFGLTEPQTAFSHAASPQIVLAILDELDSYQQGAKVEADAGDEARAQVKQLKVENDVLRSFANEMLGVAFEGGSLDGADVQDIGVRCGVLTVTEVEDRCGEVCACAEYGFPSECYRKTGVMLGTDASVSTQKENLTRQEE